MLPVFKRSSCEIHLQILETPTAKSPVNSSGSNTGLFTLLIFMVLPCPIMWFGLYVLESAVWTLALYHVLCLLPMIVWGWTLWRNTLKRPTIKQLAILFAASVLFSASSVILYEYLGDLLLNSRQTLALLVR